MRDNFIFNSIVMHGKLKKIFIIFIFFLILSVHFGGANPLVGEDDSYEKNIERGSSKEFYWIVFRNSTDNYAMSVDAEGLSDWDYEIQPSHFVLSDINPYQTVKLNISVPNFPTEEEKNASVIFSFRQLNKSEKVEIVKNVHVNVIGFTYKGEENTIFGGISNPLPAPFNNPFGALFFNIVIWIVIALIIYYFIKYVIYNVVKKTKTKLDNAIVDIIRTPIVIIIILYGVITSILRLGISIGIQETLFQMFYFIVLGIVIYVVYKIFNKILDEITMRRGGKSSSFGRVLRPIFKIIGAVIIIIGGLIYGLTLAGVQITAFLAGAGILGLVIAFAAQDTLSNFFSGIHLLLDRPFKTGDIILLESGEYCRVESVGMRSTKLYSLFDHELIILPNNLIANQRIVNIVRPDTRIKQKIEVGVAYGSDVQKVKDILYKSAANHPDVLTDEVYEPLVRFVDFDDSSLNFLLIFTVNEVMKQWKTRSDIVTEIDTRFRKENVTIPFPQRTVWLNKVREAKKKDREIKEGQ